MARVLHKLSHPLKIFLVVCTLNRPTPVRAEEGKSSASSDSSESASTEVSTPSTYQTLLLGGTQFQTGKSGVSLTGNHTTQVLIGREKSTGWLRPTLQGDFQYSKGTNLFGGTNTSYNYNSLGAVVGLLWAPLSETSSLEPFLGAEGLVSRMSFALGTGSYSRSFFYGYRLSMGFNLRLSKKSDSLRLQVRVMWISQAGTLPPLGPLKISAFGISSGLLF